MSLILSYLRESRSLRLQYLSCRSVQLLWHFSQTAVHLICFGRSLHPSHEAGLPPSPRLAGCPLRMHRGAGSRPSSACVDPCGDLWLLLQREQRLICQRVSLSPPGGSPGGARRVRSVGWHSWPGRLVLTSMGAPLQQSAASALPEGSHSASCQRKIPYRIFYSHYDYAYKSPPDCDYMPVHVGAFVGRAR